MRTKLIIKPGRFLNIILNDLKVFTLIKKYLKKCRDFTYNQSAAMRHCFHEDVFGFVKCLKFLPKQIATATFKNKQPDF